MSGFFTRFRRDRRGVSAVEFALIAPILITFYFALAELTQAMMADRRAGHAASAVGDLVAQHNSITSRNLDGIFIIADKIIEPFPVDTLKIRVSSVSQSTAGVKKLEWSYANKRQTKLTKIPTLPTGLLGDGQSVIVAEASYTYDSPLDYVLQDGVQLSKTYYLRPRKTDKIKLD